MRERFVISDGALRPWPEVASRRRARALASRSELPAPMIIRDELSGVVNPCDGKRYDSKSAYYRAVKEAGCVIVGNEAEKMMSAPRARSNVSRDEIAEAVQKVEQGYSPKLEGQRLTDERAEQYKEQQREMDAWVREREPGYDDMGASVGIWEDYDG
jgi:hypothetical protein